MPNALILNPRSRRGRQWADRAVEALQAHGVEIDFAHFPKDGNALLRAGQQVQSNGCELVVIGGGDGTISSLARFFANTQTVIGVLPLGTGNALAKDLELPISIEACCEVIGAGNRRDIDLGFAGGDYFVNVVTTGVSTQIAKHLSPQGKRWFGKLAYIGSVIRAYRQARPFEVTLDLDGEVQTFATLQVVIGSGRYHAGSLALSETASLTDGRLTVYALKSTHRADLIALAKGLVRGDHLSMPNVVHGEVRRGKLSARPAVRGTMDGEIALKTPFEFRVEPGALRVLVPKD